MNGNTNPPVVRQGPEPHEFRQRLLAWYDAHARGLPWRKSHDPYRVWVSEIMLQQTRVAAVIEHYHEFLRRFPTVQKLSAAREASVLAAWSGLGYYRRARMMHAAAKLIVRERKGKFPGRLLPNGATCRASGATPRRRSLASRSVSQLRLWTGMSSASCSGFEARFCVTGKCGRGPKSFSIRERPGDFNQSMMELGATVCTPRTPACLTCPVVDLCATRGELATSSKAVRQKKREIHYALDHRDGKVFLVQRPRDASLMAGMWELPEIEAPGNGAKPFCTVKHSITVTDYTVRVWWKELSGDRVGRRITIERLDRIALTGLARKILRMAASNVVAAKSAN